VRVLYLDNSGALMLQHGSSLEVNSHDFLPQQVGGGGCSCCARCPSHLACAAARQLARAGRSGCRLTGPPAHRPWLPQEGGQEDAGSQQSGSPHVHLLYRPGHYDVMYAY
jgi:hypothetical protein